MSLRRGRRSHAALCLSAPDVARYRARLSGPPADRIDMYVTVGAVSVRALSAAERMALSARGYHRVLKVARTIADLDADETVRQAHVAEALRYRPAMAVATPAT